MYFFRLYFFVRLERIEGMTNDSKNFSYYHKNIR